MNLPVPPDDEMQARDAPWRPCTPPTPLEPQGEAGDGAKTFSNHGDHSSMEPVDGLAGTDEPSLEGSRKKQTDESGVLGLPAQADTSESTAECMGIIKSTEGATESQQAVPEGHEERAAQMCKMGFASYSRFEQLGELVDLDDAIEFMTGAIQLTIDGDSSKPRLLNVLGVFYQSRFERLDELTDVDKSIECLTQALLLTPGDHKGEPSWYYSHLGSAYRRRFKRTGEIADLDKAIEFLGSAVPLRSDDHVDKLDWLRALGASYYSRFERLGELPDLDKAIEWLTQAALLTPEVHTRKLASLNNLLGGSYLNRFNRLGDLTDVDKSIDCLEEAVLLTQDGHANKASYLNSLGNSYGCRFHRLGELADMDKAIECHTQAMLLTPDGHPDKPGQLSNVGSSHLQRFHRLQQPADVDKAIECHIQALSLTPDGHEEKPRFLSNLGLSYIARFECLGELSDVNQAIEWHTQATLLTPDGHAEKPNELNYLGNSYRCRFERLGELADVDRAIECLASAMLLTPDDHVRRPGQLNNLGNSYVRRFGRLGDLADMDRAMECHMQAVQLTPDGHAKKPDFLNDLGISYLRRVNSLGERADMDKAIEYLTQAMLLTPENHVDRQNLLNNLGISYARRFMCLDKISDIDQAIEVLTQAVALTPDGHSGKPNSLNNLGIAYRCRFNRLGELPDVNKAVDYHSQAVLLTPDGHPGKPIRLNELGVSYERRYKSSGERLDLESARSYLQRAAQHVVTDPVTQIRSARSWAKCCSSLDTSPQSAYERCMELVPRLIWLGMTIDQRYSMLTTLSDFAGEAAAWAISVQAYDLAVEWLEQGRSVVWNQILQLRTPFDELSDFDPTLGECLKSIAAQLERAGTRSRSTEISSSNNEQADSDLEKAAQRHRRLAEDWEEALTKARNIPGLENFMRPRKVEELKRSATNGPVVLINTHSTRCDALIISPQHDDILHLPLSNLSLDKAGEFRIQLYSSVRNRGDTARGIRFKSSHKPDDSFKTLLTNIWSTIVKPILDACGYSRETLVDELPEVTWCATGSLSFLPLHAAGPYDGLSPNAFDLVISSYTPTLATLLASNVAVSTPEAGLLAVGQESTPSLPPLPFTVQELELIKEHSTAIKYLQLDGEQAKVDAVLSGMDEHSWVHMACHASQDQANPAQSGFYLSDGSLSLETITKRQFKNKGLAFLSACQTATGDSKMPDEAVHLAAGMLMSGYPSVIATMWPIRDADGPEVAGRVYAELLKGEKMDHRGAARALHKAVAELRKKVGDDISERWGWVPFIHMGV